MAKHSLSKWKSAWGQHRRDSARRSIGFDLSFREWHALWVRSGRLEERGRRKGQYVMARHGDKGPYAIGNVKIILCEENHSEGNLGKPRPKSEEHRRKISAAHKGKTLSLAHRAKIGQAQKGVPKGPMKESTKRKLSVIAKLRPPQKITPEGIERIRQAKVEYWKIRLAQRRWGG